MSAQPKPAESAAAADTSDSDVRWVSRVVAASLAETTTYGILRLSEEGKIRMKQFGGMVWYAAQDAEALRGEVKRRREARRKRGPVEKLPRRRGKD